MGCDSQFDSLYDDRREQEHERAQRLNEQIRKLEARGYTVADRQQAYSGPFIHEACGGIVAHMDVHDGTCIADTRSQEIYTPKHRA